MEQYLVQYSNKELQLTEAELTYKNISSIGHNKFHLIHNNKSIEAEIKEIDLLTLTVRMVIDHRIYVYKINNELARTIAKLGFNTKSSNQDKLIKAPMPGIVLKLEVQEGDLIVKGQNLLTLEAMKMENMIKSNSEGRIKKINVKAQDKVDKNHLMIILE